MADADPATRFMARTLRIDHSGASGTAECTQPACATAGEPVALGIVVRPGRAMPAGAAVAIVRPWPSDWGEPQAGDPAAADHLVVRLEPSGRALAWRRLRSEPWHPFDHAVVARLGQPTAVEEAIAIAAPSITAQTFAEAAAPLSVRLDAAGTGDWVEIARFHQRIDGGPPHRLVATAPSDVVAGEPFAIHLRLEDVWGNAASLPADAGPVAVQADGGAGAEFRPGDTALLRLPMHLMQPGVHRLAARTSTGLACETNPVRCHAGAPAVRRYWGDLHAQSGIGCGAGTIEACFRFARDVAAADFGSHQANCFLVSTQDWTETQAVTRALHEDGRFVTLLGVEWSGETAVGGDHNLYFPGDAAALHRCSHRHVADLSDLGSDLPHVTDLHAHYHDQDVLMAVHVGGRTSNLAWHAPRLETLVEVHSTHASSEWLVAEAMRRGWRFGVTGGSDGVDGRLAGSHPGRLSVRNLRGGLTAVDLPALTRAALWQALRAGRTYATNGPRILLDVQPLGPGRCRITVEGTAPLAAISLLSGATAVACVRPPARDPAPSGWWRLRWWGARGRGNWSQARMVWDGGAELSGARLAEARGWRWDTPAEGVRARAPDHVAWRSVTAGSWDGVLLRLEDVAAGAALRFDTAPLACTLSIDPGGAACETTDDPPRRLRLETLPRLAALPGWSGEIADPDPADDAPYWVRVEQEDGSIAWSSPFWPGRP